MSQTLMMQLFADREAYRAEREDARKRGDMTTARSLNAHIGNCTRKMNQLIFASIDASISQNRKDWLGKNVMDSIAQIAADHEQYRRENNA